MNKLVIALTGGIGSGKSTVSHFFSKLGIDVIDADVIARALVKPNTAVLKTIENYFGKQILDQKGELRRDLLRKIIFLNPEKRVWLENLLHPLIQIEMKKQVQISQSPYCIIVIPLLFEGHSEKWIDRVLTIEIPKELQIKRVIERDKCDRKHVEQILNAQVSNDVRRQGADDIIENIGDANQLFEKVKTLHQFYLNLTYSQSK